MSAFHRGFFFLKDSVPTTHQLIIYAYYLLSKESSFTSYTQISRSKIMHSSNKEHSKVIFLFSPTHISKKLDKCLHAAVCYSYRQKYHLSFYWEKHNLSLQQFIFCISYFKVINPSWSSFIIFSIFFFFGLPGCN